MIKWDEMDEEPKTGFERDREKICDLAREAYERYHGENRENQGEKDEKDE